MRDASNAAAVAAVWTMEQGGASWQSQTDIPRTHTYTRVCVTVMHQYALLKPESSTARQAYEACAKSNTETKQTTKTHTIRRQGEEEGSHTKCPDGA